MVIVAFVDKLMVRATSARREEGTQGSVARPRLCISRVSTTGPVAGSHLIIMRCKTQAVVTLSSAEAELYGLVSAPAKTMGLISMYKDLGVCTWMEWYWEMRAHLSPAARHGLGKLGHLDTNYLWIQEESSKG